MANKNIDIKFNLDTKSIELGELATKNLNVQLRELKKFAERNEGQLSAEQFAILSKQINDTSDKMKLVKTRTGELFNTFSLLPGPIGEFSQKIDGTISLMKVFSGFSFKDLRGQFKGIVDDIKGILVTLGSWGDTAKKTADANKTLTDSVSNTTSETDKLKDAQNQQTDAVNKGSRAWSLFRGALTAVGIGLAITLVSQLASKLYDYVTGASAAKKATDDFTFSLQEQEYWLNKNRQDVAATAEQNILKMKLEGKSSKEIRQQELVNLGDNLLQSQKLRDDAFAEYSKANQGNNVEILDKARENYRKLDAEFTKAYNDYKKKELQNRIDDQKDLEDAEKEKERIRKEAEQERLKAIQEDRQRRLRDVEADIALEKEKANTDETILRELLMKKFRIANEDRQLTKKEIEAARIASQREAEQEIQKDLEARQAANEKILQGVRNTNAAIISELEINLERKKALYGDDAQAAIDAERAVIMSKDQAAQQEIEQFNKLITAGQVLSSEQQKRLTEVTTSRQTYTTQLISLTNKEIEINREKNLKINDGDEKALQQTADNAELAASIRIDALKRLMQQVEIDKNFELESLNQRAELLRKNGETEIAIAAFVAEQKKLIEEGYAQKVKPLISGISDLTQQKNEESFQSFLKLGTAIGSASQLFDEGSRAAKTFSDIQELVNIANQAAIIITNLKTLGIIKETAASAAAIPVKTAEAAADGTKGAAKVPFPGSLIAIAAIIGAMVAVFASIKKIAGQKTTPPSPNAPTTTQQSGPINVVATRASGGPVYGPGTSRSDSIPTMLSNGEFVVNARSAAMFSPLLTRLNAIGNQPRFASAGMDMSSFSSNNMNLLGNTPLTEMLSRPIKTYVTAVDMSNQQQFERTIKSRSLL